MNITPTNFSRGIQYYKPRVIVTLKSSLIFHNHTPKQLWRVRILTRRGTDKFYRLIDDGSQESYLTQIHEDFLNLLTMSVCNQVT